VRFLVIAALVFSALAIAAAQLGWFDPTTPPTTPAPAPAAQPRAQPRAPRAQAPATPDDDDDAPADLPMESSEEGTTRVSVVLVDAELVDELEADAEAEHRLPPFQVTLTCGEYHAAATSADATATFSDVPQGVDCLAVARAPGWSVAARRGFAGDELSLEVSRAAALEVRVTDGHGRPVPDAYLTVRSSDGEPIADVIGALTTAATAVIPAVAPGAGEADPPPEGAPADPAEVDETELPQEVDPSATTLAMPASGVVSLEGLVRGMYTVEVSAAGHAAAFREVSVAAGGRTVSAFVMERSARLTVAVSGVDPAEVVLALEQDGSSEGPAEAAEGRPPQSVFHFPELHPGEAWLDVEVRGRSVLRQKVSLGEGEDKKLDLPLSLGTVEVVVDGSLPSPPRQVGRPGRTVMVSCGESQLVTLATQDNHAELEAVQAGTRCVGWLPDAPQVAAEVRAPGTLRLVAAPNALEVVGRDGAELLQLVLTPAEGAERSARLTGRGVARLANVTPGRYTLTGSLGQSPVEMPVEVQPTGVQRVVVSPVAMKCFTARVVDRASGEPIDGRMVGYAKAKNGYQEVLTADWVPSEDGLRQCFDAQKVAVIVVSSEGHAPAVLSAGATSLGTVALAGAEAFDRQLVEAVRPDESGAMVVDAQNGLTTSLGLRSGDRLISIDGRDVAQMVPEEVEGRLSGASGAPLRLAVRGSDGLRELTVTLP